MVYKYVLRLVELEQYLSSMLQQAKQQVSLSSINAVPTQFSYSCYTCYSTVTVNTLFITGDNCSNCILETQAHVPFIIIAYNDLTFWHL